MYKFVLQVFACFVGLLIQNAYAEQQTPSSNPSLMITPNVVTTNASAPTTTSNSQPMAPIANVKADIVFKNAAIYTVNPAQPWAQALAVRGKNIVYVGDNDGAKTFIGEQTKVVDLQDQMMLPGFHDSHIHPAVGQFLYNHLANVSSHNKTDALQKLKAAAEQKILVHTPN